MRPLFLPMAKEGRAGHFSVARPPYHARGLPRKFLSFGVFFEAQILDVLQPQSAVLSPGVRACKST
jgi:hypothetical protein